MLKELFGFQANANQQGANAAMNVCFALLTMNVCCAEVHRRTTHFDRLDPAAQTVWPCLQHSGVHATVAEHACGCEACWPSADDDDLGIAPGLAQLPMLVGQAADIAGNSHCHSSPANAMYPPGYRRAEAKPEVVP